MNSEFLMDVTINFFVHIQTICILLNCILNNRLGFVKIILKYNLFSRLFQLIIIIIIIKKQYEERTLIIPIG